VASKEEDMLCNKNFFKKKRGISSIRCTLRRTYRLGGRSGFCHPIKIGKLEIRQEKGMEALFPSDYTFVMSNEVETFAEPSCSKDDIIDALNNSLTII